jgi:hypothetical protein
VTALQRLLDSSLEIVIAVSRLVAVLGVPGWLGLLAAAIWTHDTRFVALAGLVFALSAISGAFGFWWFGNPEWRRGAPPAA